MTTFSLCARRASRLVLAGWLSGLVLMAVGISARADALTLKSKTLLDATSPRHGAIYQSGSGLAMVKQNGYSPDNGETWQSLQPTPDYDSNLPDGYRRSFHSLWRDPVNDNILALYNSMDTEGLDPNVHEPTWQWYWYYLRHRVSTDGGQSYVFDEPIVQQGAEYSADHPIDTVYIGQNCYFLGDKGSHPIRTREGTVLLPVQTPPLNETGDGFYNPGGGWYWLDSMVLIGTWTEDDRITWDASEPIKGNGSLTSRGLYEGTLAQMPDGNVLCVMRGSNGGTDDPSYQRPSRKWLSISEDGGHTWTEPEPWTFADGTPFYSPASMSELFTHSNGKTYWIGNMNDSNSQANHPRWPLVIYEVDPTSYGLIEDSRLVIDTKLPEESDVNLSHWHSYEDRATGDIIITGTRASAGYNTRTPVVYVVGVPEPGGLALLMIVGLAVVVRRPNRRSTITARRGAA